MILRGMVIENWRCICKLELRDLPEGIIVLHGPNRIGKSSLVLALRAGLFDHDPDSSAAPIKRSLPWSGASPAKVVVEFLTGGTEYRLTKHFTGSKREAKASLEKKVGSSWIIIENAPKEASRKALELLGGDRSDAGMNQLLWLSQGDVHLPQKGWDNSLQKRLVDVLGVMVTGRDLAFKETLDKRCGQWFTPKGGQKKDSPVSQWESTLQERIEHLDRQQAKFATWKKAIEELQECKDRFPVLRRAVDNSQKEVELLEQEHKQSEERRRIHREAEQALKQARQELQQAEKTLKDFQEAKKRLEEATILAADAEARVKQAESHKERCAAEHAAGLRLLEDARQAEQEHQQSRDEIEDRHKLLMLAEQVRNLERRFEELQKKAAEIQTLEERFASVSAPDEKELKHLRGMRDDISNLRAQLQASALTLTVRPEEPVKIRVIVDGQHAEEADLQPAVRRSWSLRQRVEIAVPDIGVFEVSRTQQDLDLEEAALQLSRLERDFQDAVRAFQEEPTDETCLDRLAERQIHRDAWQKELVELREEVLKLAPEGPAALQAKREHLESLRRAILERHPLLSTWQPTSSEIEELKDKFKERAAELEADRQACEQVEETARNRLKEAESTLSQRREDLAGVQAEVQAKREELARLGEESELRTRLIRAQDNISQAEAAVAESRLTESEQTIDQRLQGARTALQERARRLRDLERQLNVLEGQLQGNEGLHTELANAEAAVQEAERKLSQMRLEADAHKQLQTLFDECRDKQVQQVIGPITGRIHDWCSKIGLTDWRELVFGDSFLPERIHAQANLADKPFTIADESYGTGEQLSILVRLALGGLLAQKEAVTAILDDPLVHADPIKHRRMLEVLRLAAEGNSAWNPPAGPLQIIILTCHPDRFDHIPGARHIDLANAIER